MTTSAIRTVISEPVPERSTRVYTTTLMNDADPPIPIPASDITSLKLTLYNLDAALTLVNARDHVSVLNANGGTIHPTSGLFTFTFTPADTAILDAATSAEIRVALLEVIYGGGKELPHEVQFTVVNLAKRP